MIITQVEQAKLNAQKTVGRLWRIGGRAQAAADRAKQASTRIADQTAECDPDSVASLYLEAAGRLASTAVRMAADAAYLADLGIHLVDLDARFADDAKSFADQSACCADEAVKSVADALSFADKGAATS